MLSKDIIEKKDQENQSFRKSLWLKCAHLYIDRTYPNFPQSGLPGFERESNDKTEPQTTINQDTRIQFYITGGSNAKFINIEKIWVAWKPLCSLCFRVISIKQGFYLKKVHGLENYSNFWNTSANYL